MKENKVLSKKVAKYSLLAGAAITMIASCAEEPDPNDPNIDETDVNPDISLSAPSNGFVLDSIDINNDGVFDMAVAAYNYSYAYGGVTTAYNGAICGGVNGASVLTQQEIFTLGTYMDTATVVSALSQGNTIGPNQTVWNFYGDLGFAGTYYGYPVSIGQFLGQDKFVGVRFQAAGNTHYAWVRLSLSADGSNVMIKEYAYHVNPNTAIEAGAK